MMAAQRDYNVGKAAGLKAVEQMAGGMMISQVLEAITRAIVDAVDADREKQRLERDT